MLLQRVYEPRLAQARLADEQHDLTHAFLSLFPALLQQTHLVVAAGERRQPSRPRGVDRAARERGSHHAEELDRLGHPLDLLVAKGLAVELSLDQPVGGCAANDLTGFGHVLEPDGYLPRLSDQRNRILHRLHNCRPSVNADPWIQFQLLVAIGSARPTPSVPR